MGTDRQVSGVEEAFDELVGDLDYPMLIVTAASGDERGGCLVGFATQASISPSRFIVCLSKRNLTCRIASRAEHLAVHVVPADATELAELFGGDTGDEVDKFSRTEWQPGPGGTPLLDGCRNRFVGRVLERRPYGDHVAFVLEPVLAEHPEAVRALPFRRAKRIDPGHEA
jgi:flavin reductase (DIM6/NTAB) family NADH-FMN oxidoreductase RutF